MMNSEWKFVHVGMVVKDLEKTVEQLRALGLISTPARETLTLKGKAPDQTEGAGQILMREVTCAGLCIELLQPLSGDNLQQRWLNAHGEGISHVCYEVPDIAKARDQMAAQGVAVLCHIRDSTTYYETGEPGSLQIELRQSEGPV